MVLPALLCGSICSPQFKGLYVPRMPLRLRPDQGGEDASSPPLDSYRGTERLSHGFADLHPRGLNA